MTEQEEICPICGEGHLEHRVEKNLVEYNGQSTQLDCHYSVCELCGSEQATSDQTRANKRAMMAFKKSVDGLLTGAEIKALRVRWRINQTQAATIFGGGPVAFSKYENDDVMQSEAMDKLLRVAAEMPDVFRRLVQKAGVTPVRVSSPINKKYCRIHVFDKDKLEFDLESPVIIRPNLRWISSSKTVRKFRLNYR